MLDARRVALDFAYAAWPLWFVIWIYLSRNSKKTARQETVAAQLSHIVPLGVALALIYSPLGGWAVLPGLLPHTTGFVCVGAVLVAVGMGFTFWARTVLAGNWSGLVEVKQGHELVCRGPYAMARHPIYTGLLAAVCGNVLVSGSWATVLALIIVTVSFVRKYRREEQFMRAQFGAAYDEYAARTPALVPGMGGR